MKLLVVTGMSGAGKSLALKMLEDCGYESLDHVPHALLRAIANAADQKRNLAVGVNVSARDFAPQIFIEIIESLRANPSVDCKLVFLDSDDDKLSQRLHEISDQHPLLPDRTMRDGIKYERQLLMPIRDIADITIDSSDYEDLDLRRYISSHFSPLVAPMSVVVTSFSYKRGVPREADFVFDVRFLQNPHYVPALKALTGLEKKVAAYIEEDPDFDGFFEYMSGTVIKVLPRQAKRRPMVIIGVGCTGGRHRSVHVAEKLGKTLHTAGYEATVRHRDIL